MRLIDPRHDPWQPADPPEGSQAAPQAHALLSPTQWRVVRDRWPRHLPAGLVLANDADVQDLREDLPRLQLIVLQFPKWTDGRAYSQARLLRARLRYGGGLRASGEVLVDMLPLLQRTGFDSVRLRADQDAGEARRALHYFRAHYQGDAVQTQPWFARLAA